MDNETKEIIADYFTPYELVELLDIDVHYLVDLLDEEILEKLDAIFEYMGMERE